VADVTIGIPVYNGALMIEEALKGLLNGSYRDIKIIVSDNASTDDTADRVNRIAKTDKRVTLIRQSENLGPVKNFLFVAAQAETPFFLWRAHDDISDDNFIEVLREKLLENPSAVLAAPKVITRKPKGDNPRPFNPILAKNQYTGWKNGLSKAHAGWMYGMFRTKFAQNSVQFVERHYPHIWGWDMLVILETLLTNTVIGTNKTTFYHRLSPKPDAQYQFSKKQLRQIARDFYKCGKQLANQYEITGKEQLSYRIKLLRYVFQRVTRWQRLI